MTLLSFLAMWSYRREIPPPGGVTDEKDSETQELLTDSLPKKNYTNGTTVVPISVERE